MQKVRGIARRGKFQGGGYVHGKCPDPGPTILVLIRPSGLLCVRSSGLELVSETLTAILLL